MKELPAYYQAILNDFNERTNQDGTPKKRRHDLKQEFFRLKRKHGALVCEAAAGIITREECALLLREPLWKIREYAERANYEARALLREYVSCLPARLQRKYQYQGRD